MESQTHTDKDGCEKGKGQGAKGKGMSFKLSPFPLSPLPFLHPRLSAVNLILRFVALLACVAASALMVLAQETPPAQKTNSEPPKKINERPAALVAARPEPFDTASIEKMAGQCVRLETEAGVIEVEMLAESAPEAARNFLNLAATGAFETTTFSRVVKGFVIQGGNLSTRQTLTPELAGRSVRTIPDEPNNVKHVRGIVSMARPEKANSATTHFFILVSDAPHLDGKFSAFARVVRGMDVVDAINQSPVKGEAPEKPVRVRRAVVYHCPAVAPTEDGEPR